MNNFKQQTTTKNHYWNPAEFFFRELSIHSVFLKVEPGTIFQLILIGFTSSFIKIHVPLQFNFTFYRYIKVISFFPVFLSDRNPCWLVCIVDNYFITSFIIEVFFLISFNVFLTKVHKFYPKNIYILYLIIFQYHWNTLLLVFLKTKIHKDGLFWKLKKAFKERSA